MWGKCEPEWLAEAIYKTQVPSPISLPSCLIDRFLSCVWPRTLTDLGCPWNREVVIVLSGLPFPQQSVWCCWCMSHRAQALQGISLWSRILRKQNQVRFLSAGVFRALNTWSALWIWEKVAFLGCTTWVSCTADHVLAGISHSSLRWGWSSLSEVCKDWQLLPRSFHK